eukprot:177894_1
MSLNVNAQEFIPQFTSKSKTDNKSTKKKQSAPTNTNTNKPIQSFKNNTNTTNNPHSIYPPQTISNNQYIPNNTLSNEYITNPYINNPKQKPQLSNEELIKQQQEKQKQILLIQRKATLNQLISLFPSIDSNKLQIIFKTNVYNIKRAILYVLQSPEFKGSFDKSICVYHLSNTCQFENNPSKCRYSHDRQVPSAICQFWLNDTCLKDEQCQFIHKIPKKKKKNIGS